MAKVWADTESVGLVGFTKLVQYAVDDGPVQFIPLPKGWESVQETRNKLNEFFSLLDKPENTLVAYNLPHDYFHLVRLRHRLEGYEYDSEARPIAPFKADSLDLFTWAVRRSPLAPFAFAKSGSKSVAAVRRIPRVARDIVAARVEAVLRPLLPSVIELKRSEHEVPGSKNLVSISWSIAGRLSLKNLMKVYGLPVLVLSENWPLPDKGAEALHLPYPQPVHEELEPVCDMILSDQTLPFWSYAALDVWFLRMLYDKLDRPESDHHDACCANMGYVRYHGYPVDRQVLLATKEAYEKKVAASEETLAGTNLKSSKQRLALLRKYDPLIGSSKKSVVQALAESDRPCAHVAKAMLQFGQFKQRLDQVNKCLECKIDRVFPTLRVMGTRTGRMAGDSGLNWQGIPKVKRDSKIGIRRAMKVAAVGDWSALEVVLGANVYQDEVMFQDIENKVDPHAMTASLMIPKAIKNGWTYEMILKGYEAGDPEMTAVRSSAKPCNFLLQYFGGPNKLAASLGISVEEAEKSFERYYSRLKGFAAYRRRMEKECLTADTEHWSKDSVARMAYEITDMTGYTISWSAERSTAMALWKLGGEGIHTGIEGSILRSKEKGTQSIDQSIRSALLGGAISIQNAVVRQRGNAAVQSLGANLTKMLQARIWNKFRMPSTNLHDELVFIECPMFNWETLKAEVDAFVNEWLPTLRGIKFDMKVCKFWSDK